MNPEPQANHQPKAFVIMPFGDDETQKSRLKVIYEHFKKKLYEYGFNTQRADEMPGSQNILDDTIRAIDESNLIVAELTDNNPNVLFELAIGYSLDKPAILLTQGALDELLFDLSHYRVVQYSSAFDQMMLAEEALRLGASAFLNGDRAYFGNPVSEYFDRQVKVSTDIEEESADLRLYDYFEQIHEGSHLIVEAITNLHNGQQRVTNAMSAATQELTTVQENRPRMRIMRRVASEVEAYASLIDEKIGVYEGELDRQEIAVEAVMQEINLDDDDNREAYTKLVNTFDELVGQIQLASESTDSYKATLQEAPSIERRFNRARTHLIRSLSLLLDEFERHRLLAERVRQIGRERLGEIDK